MPITIRGPGVYDVPAEQYHADRLLQVPTLNASTLAVLDAQTPLHAWWQHPRLNPGFERDTDKQFDFGSAMHAALLGSGRIAVLAAENYRTKAAQEQRDAAFARGSIPILPHQMDRVQVACKAVRRQLATHEASDALLAGKPEQTLVWTEAGPEGIGMACRARLDWLPDETLKRPIFYDLKTTTDANPQVWVRRLFDIGADVQAVFYARGITRVLQIPNPVFRFVVVEAKAPHAISVIQLSPSALELAIRKVEAGIKLWGECVWKNEWPGYPPFVHHVDTPPWKQAQFEERQFLREQRQQFLDNTTILGG